MELDFDVKHLFKVLRDHLIVIIIVGLIFAMAICFYTSFVVEKQYSSTTKLELINKNSYEYAQEGIIQANSTLGKIFENMSKSTDALTILKDYLSSTENGGLGKYPNITVGALNSMISVKADEYGFLTYTVTTKDPVASYDIAKAIYDLFPTAFTDGILSSYNIPVITSIVPQVPSSPSSPNVKLYTAIAGVGGAFLTWLLFLILSIVNTNIVTKEDITSSFDLPIIGEIPNWRKGK